MEHRYRELDVISVPEDVPALGVEAGTLATVDTVYAGGRMLSLEIGREDGSSAGFVDVEVEDDGALRVVGYSPIREPIRPSVWMNADVRMNVKSDIARREG
jgi:hypothetical protein